MSDFEEFNDARLRSISGQAAREDLKRACMQLLAEFGRTGYLHNFDWLGLPIIQLPQDVVAIQELIWSIKPRVVVETGIARGGSLALSASILELLRGDGIAVGIDIDIRAHNRAAIESHPLAHRIHLIEGSSTDASTVDAVRALIGDRSPVLIFLDSDHTCAHVLRELELYSPFVGKASYVVVFDTSIHYMAADYFPERAWGPDNNPFSAVHAFLRTNSRFEVDREWDAKLLLSVCPSGFLKCTSDP